MILADGVLGQMLEPIEMGGGRRKTGVKELPPKDWVLDGCRDRKPRFIRSLLMGEGQLEEHNWKLERKYEAMRQEIRYETRFIDDAEFLLVAFGIASRVCLSAAAQARKRGLKVGIFRPVTLWPFPYNALSSLCSKIKSLLVVELNLGQMVEDVKLAVEGRRPVYLHARPGGGLPSSEEVVDRIQKIDKEKKG